MYKYVIADLKNGYEVYVNMIDSLAGQYLSRQPYVLNLVKEVLKTKKLSGPIVTIETDMGRTIGNTDIIETTEKDTIFYAQAYKKEVFSRYAKNRHPSPSNKLTIILERDTDGHYQVINTWIGPSTPPFPGDLKETAKSKSYWETHALVEHSQDIQSKTITKSCPY